MILSFISSPCVVFLLVLQLVRSVVWIYLCLFLSSCLLSLVPAIGNHVLTIVGKSQISLWGIGFVLLAVDKIIPLDVAAVMSIFW